MSGVRGKESLTDPWCLQGSSRAKTCAMDLLSLALNSGEVEATIPKQQDYDKDRCKKKNTSAEEIRTSAHFLNFLRHQHQGGKM